MLHFRLVGTALAALTTAGAFAQTAFVQTAFAQTAFAQTGDEELVGEDIVVEGELLDRTLQESQTSVTVVTGEELERRNDTSLRSVAERVPGVSTSSRGIGFVIRGVDERGVDANGSSATAITTSIDGARISDFGRINTSFLSTWDLEQVEFLRGPQSTQSGRNALAGAVIVRSKDPTFEPEAKVRLGIGSGETFQASFAANQPLIEDTLAIRVSADFNHTSGFIDNPTTGRDDDGGVENLTFRGSVKFEPTDNFWSVLKLSYFDNVDSFASSETASFPDRIVTTDALTQDSSNYTAVNLRMGYEFTDQLSIESETVYVDRQYVFNGDFDGGPLPLATAFDDQRGESITQEIKLLYDDDWIKAVIGGFYTRTDETSNAAGILPSFSVAPPSALPFLTPGSTVTGASFGTTLNENFAVFGEVDVEVIEDLRLIVGGRYDRETQDRFRNPTTTTDDPVLAPFLPPDTPETTSASFDAFLPKAGIVYNFTDDISLGFTFQRGYRAGGANFNLARNQQFEFDPEFTNNYEVSFRSTWFDDRLTVNANAYYVDWTDQQVVVALSAQPLDTETQNAGSSTSFGGELEVRAEPTDGLSLYASLGYVNTEFDDFLSNGVQLAGNEFRNAPEFTGAIGGTYYFLDGFFVGADATYTSASFNDAANSPALRSDSRFVLNLNAGYETEHFTITGFIDNVTDNTYAEERGATLTTIGDPLSFGLIAQIQF
ncbi:MAG: TonB-dependent receptor [Pseudomonadota bacterium]